MRRECTQHVNVFALHCPPIFVLTPCLCHTTQHQNQHQHHMRTALFFYRIPIFGPTFLFTAYSPNLDSISNSPPPSPPSASIPVRDGRRGNGEVWHSLPIRRLSNEYHQVRVGITYLLPIHSKCENQIANVPCHRRRGVAAVGMECCVCVSYTVSTCHSLASGLWLATCTTRSTAAYYVQYKINTPHICNMRRSISIAYECFKSTQVYTTLS